MWLIFIVILTFVIWYWYQQHRSNQSRFGLSSISREYLTGLNYLLNEQDDKAVETFIKMLEVDSDTVETHLALGGLFRRRGEVDRAIRIHQNIIARPKLKPYLKHEALMALGRDYLAAGVYDRAERIFLQVVEAKVEPSNAALFYLLDIYQLEKSWEEAIHIARQIQSKTGRPMGSVIAHHYCELAEEAIRAKDDKQANVYLKKALTADAGLVRVNLLHATMLLKSGSHKAALEVFQKIAKQHPNYRTEMIEDVMRCYHALGQSKEGTAFIECLHTESSTSESVKTIPLGDMESTEKAIVFLSHQLTEKPSINGLHELLLMCEKRASKTEAPYYQMVSRIAKKIIEEKPLYRCENCGFASKSLHWHCPSCKRWNTIKPLNQHDLGQARRLENSL